MSIDTWAIVIATGLGPFLAVLITLWHEDRKEKRAAKERLFVTIMANRKSLPLPLDWARALNLIDVVFEGSPKVIKAWHDFYDILHTQVPPGQLINQGQVDYRRTELLSQMAQELGYTKLQQNDIERFYIAAVHAQEGERNYALQVELLAVLKNINALAQANAAKQAQPAAVPPH